MGNIYYPLALPHPLKGDGSKANPYRPEDIRYLMAIVKPGDYITQENKLYQVEGLIHDSIQCIKVEGE